MTKTQQGGVDKEVSETSGYYKCMARPRLRVFDLRTPWFWIMLFFGRRGKKHWTVEFWKYGRCDAFDRIPRKWWLHVWNPELPEDVLDATILEESEREVV